MPTRGEGPGSGQEAQSSLLAGVRTHPLCSLWVSHSYDSLGLHRTLLPPHHPTSPAPEVAPLSSPYPLAPRRPCLGVHQGGCAENLAGQGLQFILTNPQGAGLVGGRDSCSVFR